MTKSSLGTLVWSGDARWITGAFLLFLATSGFGVPLGLPAYVASGGISLAAAGAIAGYRSSRMFGGRRNFTGRFLILFSIALALQVFRFSLIVVLPPTDYLKLLELYGAGQPTILTTLTNVLLGGSFLVSAVALLISVKVLYEKLDRRMVRVLLLSLGVSLLLVTFNALTNVPLTASKTFSEAIVRGVPFLLGVPFNIVFAALLVSLLGKWYGASGIGLVAFGWLTGSILFGLARSFALLSGLSTGIALAAFMAATTVPFYLMGLGMNQTRPKTAQLSKS